MVFCRRLLLMIFIMIPSIRYSSSFRSSFMKLIKKSPIGACEQMRCKSSSNIIKDNEFVKLLSGEDGRIIAKGKGGWMSVLLLRNNEVIKIRRSDLQECTGLEESKLENVVLEPQVNILKSSNHENITHEQMPLQVLNPPDLHKSFCSWAIFSDLHVKASSIATCEKVLDEIHEYAIQRNAGIIFLGDFWHVRGALSVDLLNRILKSLQKWNQPVIMIPGNHDQVTLGGKIHALEPLKYAFRDGQILMIDEPAICMNALWIPYRRSHATMKYILSESWQNPDISAIFCHADVKGAWMNDGMQSREGIDVQLFPPNIPIFSGHFHKPHSVAFSFQSLRYVGSPYQTSLSEADQIKYFYEVTLSSANGNKAEGKQFWKETHKLPITIGKRYFKIDVNKSRSKLEAVREGDTVVLQGELKDRYDIDALARELRNKGVDVEVREPQSDGLFVKSLLTNSGVGNTLEQDSDTVDMGIVKTIQNEIQDETTLLQNSESKAFSVGLDNMSPLSLFMKYMGSVELGLFQQQLQERGLQQQSVNKVVEDENMAIAQHIRDKVVEEGRHTIERLQHQRSGRSENHGGGAETMAVLNADHRHLVLDSVQLRNFGPYGGAPVTYPLSQRGLVLLRGQASDKTGADSNGSGKTTLAMSILWALTGSMDTRLINEGRNYEVAFDMVLPPTGSSTTPSSGTSKRIAAAARRTAEVSLKGHINGKAFEIIRRKSSKKQELFFYVDQQDLTNQAVKDTQAVLDAWLGLDRGVLQRCFFFGQHSHTAQSLLGLTDTRMKEELGPLIDLDIWTSCTADIRSRDKVVKTEIGEVQVSLKYLQQQELPRLQVQVKLQEQNVVDIQLERQGLLQTRESSSSGVIGVFPVATLSSLQENITRSGVAVKQLEEKKIFIEKEQISAAQKQLMNLLNEQAFSTTPTAVIGLMQQSPQSTRLQKRQQLQLQLSKTAATKDILFKTVQENTQQFEEEIPRQISQLDQEIRQYLLTNELITTALKLNTDTALLGKGPISAQQLDDFLRNRLDESIGHIASLDEQIRTINATLQRLLSPLNKSEPMLSTLPVQGQSSLLNHSHENADTCPTCNQLFPTQSRQERQRSLIVDLQSLLQHRNQSLQQQRRVQEQYEIAKVLIKLDQQRDTLRQQEQNIYAQVQLRRAELQQHEQVIQEIQGQLHMLQQEEQEEKEQLHISIQRLQSGISLAELQVKRIDEEIFALRQEKDISQNQYVALKEQEGQFNITLSILEEKLRAANENLQASQNHVQQIMRDIEEFETRRRKLLDQSMILSYLMDFFGSKGIQHYIFQSVIDRLEYLANTYLEVMTNGGIRLQLRSDPDGEKITKYVLMRHNQLSEMDGLRSSGSGDIIASGNNDVPLGFRERSLAQLSGGQWRRVSLALDFAFTELVIRRGLLKCNVLVLDEILTHLDGQGREAVGSVLKAMIDRTTLASSASPSPASTTGVFGGGFETIIVILQDLIANEIEEAFDHIDIVRKEGDVSQVILDS